jgi:hypothetical protein
LADFRAISMLKNCAYFSALNKGGEVAQERPRRFQHSSCSAKIKEDIIKNCNKHSAIRKHQQNKEEKNKTGLFQRHIH